ncbi:MAG: hypothetical protein P1V21_08140 [Rhizobiaceae bacterium]|nr:hypothetical protein [Rhizobiaceae bacterium]
MNRSGFSLQMTILQRALLDIACFTAVGQTFSCGGSNETRISTSGYSPRALQIPLRNDG